MAHQLPKMKIHLEVLRLASFNIKFCQNEKKKKFKVTSFTNLFIFNLNFFCENKWFLNWILQI
jgi:hypothetical protein